MFLCFAKSIKKIIALGFLLSAFLRVACADPLLQDINLYLKTIDKMAIDFSQKDSSGASFEGTLIIDKPHKFRCNYYAPYPLLIVGGKSYVSVYDFKMKSLSRIKAKENPLNFLLLGEIDINNKFKILDISESENELLVQLKEKRSGRVSRITFDKLSKTIKALSIIEADNVIELVFHRHSAVNSIDQKLFQLRDPNLFQKPTQLNREELYKLLF